MHPAPAFRPAASDAAIAFAGAYAFAHIVGVTPVGLRVAHAPVLVSDTGTLLFHLSNGNALTPHLDGAAALVSIGGPGSYVSPNWYADHTGHVPTWNYRAAEFNGAVRAMTFDELGDLLDRASALFEPRVGQDWTMAKLAPARRDALMRAITGFELTPATIRMTDKASQNRSDADARGIAAAMTAIGDEDGAAAIRRVREW